MDGNAPLYVSQSEAVASMHGPVSKMNLSQDAKILDLANKPDSLLSVGAMDSLGWNAQDIERIKRAGYDAVIDSDDIAKGYDQAIIINRDIIKSDGLLGVGRPKAQDLQGNNIELPDNFIEEINQTQLFRGLDSSADDGLIDGKYFTDDPSTAYSYTGEGANRRMVRAAPDIKRPYVVDYQGRAKSDRLDRKYIRQARDGDYDAVVFLNIADSKRSGYRGPGNPSLHERALSGVPSTVVIPLSDDAIRDMSSEVIDQVGGGVRASAAQKSAWEQAMGRMRSHKSNITITDKTKK